VDKEYYATINWKDVRQGTSTRTKEINLLKKDKTIFIMIATMRDDEWRQETRGGRGGSCYARQTRTIREICNSQQSTEHEMMAMTIRTRNSGWEICATKRSVYLI